MFQRQHPTSGGTIRSIRPANCCQLISPNRFFDSLLIKAVTALELLATMASFSQEMYTRTLALLQIIHVRCVLAMSQVVG